MAEKDLDHLRLWISNVMPPRIQLQFCGTEFQLFFNTTTEVFSTGWVFWSEHQTQGWFCSCQRAVHTAFGRLHSCSPTSSPAAGKHIPPAAFSSLCKPFILFVGFLSFSKLNSLSQKYLVEGLTSGGSYLQRQAANRQSWQCPNINNWAEIVPFLVGFLNLTCKKTRD